MAEKTIKEELQEVSALWAIMPEGLRRAVELSRAPSKPPINYDVPC